MSLAIRQPKAAFLFRVHFDSFGTGTAAAHLTAQVLRTTRPGVLVTDILGQTDVQPTSIEIDLRDDISDRTRAEVVTQIGLQIRDDATFSLVIEVLDSTEKVVEQWFLNDCQITCCDFDELATGESAGLTIGLVIGAKRIATTAFGEILELFD